MITFKPFTLADKPLYERYLAIDRHQRGCEFSFANVYLWGRQQFAMIHDHIVLFSQFDRRTVYPYPIGDGDKKPVLDAIIADAAERGIKCRLSGLDADAKQTLETLYPNRFRFHCSRDSFDYVYDIDNLADLAGRKYHRKRNHYNRFRENNPGYTVEPIDQHNLPLVKQMVDTWYADKLAAFPDSDFDMERVALDKALRRYHEMALDGLVLRGKSGDIWAMTIASRLSTDTMDVHFEKARSDIDGAYTAINCEFARYLRGKYPYIRYLDREEDMGLEGLRKAKLSYYPHHLIEKCWARLLEEGYDY